MRATTCWTSLALGVALLGCGSSGGKSADGGPGSGGSGGHASGAGGAGAGSGFSTGLPNGTKLVDLTPSQLTQLCDASGAYEDQTLLPVGCKAVGLQAAYLYLFTNPQATDTDLQTQCTQAQSSCLTNDGGFSTTDCALGAFPSTCTATVGDFQTCLEDQSTADVQYSSSLPSCSSLTAATLTAALTSDAGAAEPASCSEFDPTCDVDGGAMSGAHRAVRRVR